MSQLQLFKYFSNIDDPRQQGKVVHKLFDILFLTISAVIAGVVFKFLCHFFRISQKEMIYDCTYI
jgi:hypothetical protein